MGLSEICSRQRHFACCGIDKNLTHIPAMIKVAQIQRGNPLLNYLNKSIWSYDSATSADYEINSSIGVLFLSLRFHSCKPEYIYKRINRMRDFRLRVVVVLIDVPNYNVSLRELFNMIPVTLVLCKSYEECSKYIRGFDIASKRPVAVLRRKEASIDQFLLSVPRINKTDVINLRNSYATLQDLLRTPGSVLARTAGIGPAKVEALAKYLKKDFNSEECSKE